MKDKLKQFIAFGVASVVALVVCMTVLVMTVNNLDNDISTVTNKTIINKTELDSSKVTLVEYINKLIIATDDRFVKTKAYTDISVDDIKVLNSEKTQVQDEALLIFVKDKMLSVVDGYYEECTDATFEKNNSKKLNFAINKNALINADFSVGQVDENGESVFDDEGNLVDEGYYFLTYDVDFKNKEFSRKISEIFSVDSDVNAKDQFVNSIKGNCKIKDFQAEPESFIINAKVNRANDEIQYINVIKKYAVNIKVEFINEVERLGEKDISFAYTVTDTYEYSYAGISFVEDEVTIEHDEEYMLNVNAVIDDDSYYTVEFESSMEDMVSVDEMGYIKGLKNSDAPTIITVKLNYLGETFTDTCVVYVDVKEGL